MTKRFLSWVFGRMKRRARLVAARRVAGAFKGVEWRKQMFGIGNGYTFEVDGETKFYKASEIDAAIERMNAVLRDLSK